MTGLLVGLDIGATKILGVVTTADGTVVAQARVSSPVGGDDVVASAAKVLTQLHDQIDEDVGAVVGVGIPGLVDTIHGTVRHAVNLGIEDGFPFAERLSEATGSGVVLDNDANAAALGASRIVGYDDLAYLSIGTGLAVATIHAGRLHRGARNAAGEIGHIPVDPSGPTCECGQTGCLETLASGSALAALWPTTGRPAAQALFYAAASGDPQAQAVRDRFAGHVADAVRLIALTIDPEVVVLGGGVAHVGERLRAAVANALTAQAASSPFLASLALPGRIRLVPDDVPVAAIGAALLGCAGDRR